MNKIISTIIITALVAGGSMYFYMSTEKNTITNNQPTAEVKCNTTEVECNKETIYKNKNIGFSLVIPASWGNIETIKATNDDSHSIEAVTIKSKDSYLREFTIYVYDDKKNVPDGVFGRTVFYENNEYSFEVKTTFIGDVCLMDDRIPQAICDELKSAGDEVFDILKTIKIDA